MKYFVLLLMSLLLIFGLIFNCPRLSNFRSEAKKEIGKKIFHKLFREKDIVRFNMKNLINAKWIAADEFIKEDKMYDVIKKEIQDGKLILVCIEDHHENKIREVQKFVSETFNFKSFQIPEMRVPKVVVHSQPNQFCEMVEKGKRPINLNKFLSHQIPALDCRFADFYYQKFNIPPENFF